MRSTSLAFGEQVRRLLRSFPRGDDNGLSPTLTLSFVVAPPSRGRTIKPFHFAYSGYSQIGRTADDWQLFRFLEWQLDILLAEKVESMYLLHAGGVSRNGAGIIMPGPSGSGKSSLTLALLLRGYRYLSDELAVIDPSSNQLQPFPKPISIKDTSVFPELARHKDLWLGPETGERSREVPVWYVHPEDVTAGSVGGPVPIRYIIFPSYDPTVPSQLHRLSAGQAMQQLIENSVNLHRFGRDGLHVLGNLVEEAQCFSLTTNGLEEATALVEDLTGK